MDDTDDADDGDESDDEDDVAKENETNAKGERHVQIRDESETGESTGIELEAAAFARLGASNALPEIRNETPSALTNTKMQSWDESRRKWKKKKGKFQNNALLACSQ